MNRLVFLLVVTLLVVATPMSLAKQPPAKDAGCATRSADHTVLVLWEGARAPTVNVSVERMRQDATTLYRVKLNGTILKTFESASYEVQTSGDFTVKGGNHTEPLSADSRCIAFRAPGERVFTIMWRPFSLDMGAGDCEDRPLRTNDIAVVCLDVAGQRSPWPTDSTKSIPLALTASNVAEHLTLDRNLTTIIISEMPVFDGTLAADVLFPGAPEASLAGGVDVRAVNALLASAANVESSRRRLEDADATEIGVHHIVQHAAAVAALATAARSVVARPPSEAAWSAASAELLTNAASRALRLYVTSATDCREAPLSVGGDWEICAALGEERRPVGDALKPEAYVPRHRYALSAFPGLFPELPQNATARAGLVQVDLGTSTAFVNANATLAEVDAALRQLHTVRVAISELRGRSVGDPQIESDVARAESAEHNARTALEGILADEAAVSSYLAASRAEIEALAVERMEPRIAQQRLLVTGAALACFIVTAAAVGVALTRRMRHEHTRAAFRQARNGSRARLLSFIVLGIGLCAAVLGIVLASPTTLVPFLLKGSP